MTTTQKVRILFLAANPETTSRLDLEEELRSLEGELRTVEYRDQVELIAALAVRPDDVVRLLRRETPTVVHFSGHGARAGIVLRSDEGHLEVSGNVLARILRDRGVKLVFLNACFSELQAEPLATVVPAVVGTTDAVGDEAARRFSTAFYRTIGDGHAISEAFRDGRDAVDIHLLDDVFRLSGDGSLVLCGRGRSANALRSTADLTAILGRLTRAERLTFRAILKASSDINTNAFREFFRAANTLSGNQRDGYAFRLTETVGVASSELSVALNALRDRGLIFGEELSDVLFKPTPEVVAIVNRSPNAILGLLYTPTEVENRPVEVFHGITRYRDGKPALYTDLDGVPLEGPFLLDDDEITVFHEGKVIGTRPRHS